MLLPAKHVEQLLLLAANPWGAHTKSINGLLRLLSVVMQHLIFHQVKSSMLCCLLQAESQTLVAMACDFSS